MAVISRLTTWSDGQTLTASALNGEFDNILSDYNGGITNANISNSAAISYSKLNLTGAVVAADIASGSKTGSGSIVFGTNPTLTKPTVNGSIQAYTSDSDAATVTFDMSASNVHTVTLGGNRTLAVSNVSVGQTFFIRLVQDGTGSKTVTWFSTIKWPGATAPTLTTTANRVDTFGFLCTSSGNYDGFIVGQNLG